MADTLTPDAFALKTPCADCPFRAAGGVRHGSWSALRYAGYFIAGDGATFPCHRSVPASCDRSEWTPWQAGQVLCAGGLLFSERLGLRSRTVQALTAHGYDPSTLTGHDLVFDSLRAMLEAHDTEKNSPKP